MCECCDSIGIFDSNCLRCKARHYVFVLFEREQKQVSRQIRETWPADRIAEFQRYVEEERGGSGAVADVTRGDSYQ